MVGSVGTEQPPVLQPPVMRTFLLQDTLHILLHYLLRGPSFSEIPCTFFYIICYEDLPSPRYLAHSFTLLVMRTLLLQESLHNHLMIPIVASSQQQSIRTKLFF